MRAHVLLIEDDDTDRKICALDLQFDGHEISQAPNGEEGLRLARAFGPDVIILDIGLPGMDGFEVLREIKDDPLLHEIPVVLLTARDQLEDELEGMTSGADRYLVKPAHRDLLAETVKDVLQSTRR